MVSPQIAMRGATQLGVAAMLALGASIARAELRFDFQPAQTEIARQISSLHALVQVVCVVVVLVVAAVLVYSIVRFRRSRGHKPGTLTTYRPLELTWTVIPILIVVGLAIPATSTVYAMKDTSNPDITIKITGYQWKWRYEYLNEDLGFYSTLSTPRAQIENREAKGENYLLEVDRPMVVPVGKKVRILVTANDVIHTWAVPAFGVKQDGIPGFVRDSWFRVDKPGTYRGQCSELCGKDHGFMPIVVNAVSLPDYTAWVDEQHATKRASVDAATAAAGRVYTLDELKAEGAKVYAQNCVACHQANGQGMPPAFPALAGGKTSAGPLPGAVNIVVNGSAKNPAMVAWKGSLSDLEIASVITYVRHSFGNELGDTVQPKDIAAARR